MKLGAAPAENGGTSFRVWAPRASRVELHLLSPRERWVDLERDARGYFSTLLPDVEAGARYRYRLDGERERPDPASRHQPDGVHGPSCAVDLAFAFAADHAGLELADYVTYEIHVGTFTREGTFDAVIDELPRLRDLGVTAIELMPVAQFPGTRNWGYDGVYPFAVQGSYGGVRGLQRLSDACHAHGLSLVLDVVYNHLGPEGNYLNDYGFYFTESYRTPWGAALNFDGPHSDEVRRFFIENALQWVEEFRVDALRLDAVHAIVDRSATPFLEELGLAVHDSAARAGRKVHVFAESDANDPRLVRPRERGGYGLDAMWCDDLHHSLHALLTKERGGYYVDFGKVADLGDAMCHGMTYADRYSSYRKRRHGREAKELAPRCFVVCAQNHDQVGNRMLGERLSALVPFEAQKLAAACSLLSPELPLLFMGEEYGELAPFLYFISHGDPRLVEAVRAGRRREFRAFGWRSEPLDPQAEDTFERCRLGRALRERPEHAALECFHHELLALRRELGTEAVDASADEDARVLQLFSREAGSEHPRYVFFAFGDQPTRIVARPPHGGRYRKRLSSADVAFGGPSDTLPAVLETPTELELPPLCAVAYVGYSSLPAMNRH